MTDEDGSGPAYRVVVNDEEQYSIWPADREPPAGWAADGAPANREDCLDRISREWTDLRPSSLRRRVGMESA
ncbi:MbtH family protein [Lentzea sp. NPDC051213]|uniref:MbtH family protein n=1 Tax=Lentzea sp. NPDC051213 TaxID=3364126 RepID=UPI00379DBCB7